MSALELKIPPLVLVVAFAAGMWMISLVAPALWYPFPLRHLLALVCVILGLGVAAAGVVSFRNASTTVNPLKPETSTALVDTGVYRYTRNPMYLGFLLILLGWAVLLANVLSALFLPGFVWYMNRFQIRPEERALVQLFGSDFTGYSERVGRWL